MTEMTRSGCKVDRGFVLGVEQFKHLYLIGKGWERLHDDGYSSVYANPQRLLVCSYTEGSVCIITASCREQFDLEVCHQKEWLEEYA